MRDVMIREVLGRPVVTSLFSDRLREQVGGLSSHALQVMAFALTDCSWLW
ncbi:MAG: hypothetical protein ACREMA_14315 [Longimicrobiales bacterium]